MKTTKVLFEESIAQYKTIIQHATELSKNMTSLSPEEILQQCEILQDLQNKQLETDKFIVDVMINTGATVLDMPCVGEYQRILDEARRTCDKVASKAKTIQALLKSEIQKLKKGQKGLAGYTSTNTNTKSSVQVRY